MAWIAPPTFSTDDVLTATNLNILSNDLEYLHGFVSGANPAIASTVLTIDGECRYIIRHLQRYLHGVYLCQNDIEIHYSADGVTWTQVFDDGAPNGTVADSLPPVDLNPFGFTVGALYFVRCTMDSGTVFYLYESDSAS
jgi:hypothetical protein